MLGEKRRRELRPIKSIEGTETSPLGVLTAWGGREKKTTTLNSRNDEVSISPSASRKGSGKGAELEELV